LVVFVASHPSPSQDGPTSEANLFSVVLTVLGPFGATNGREEES
jgi:hypothetical protein